MQSAPLPDNEAARLTQLKRYRILDTPPEASFDRIARIVREVLDVPIALISLIDESRQWFKARQGLDLDAMPREHSVCAYTILNAGPLVIADLASDERFAGNTLLEKEQLRFYAGVPLTSLEGLNLGTLCALDTRPRTLTAHQITLLQDLARLAMDEMELRLALQSSLDQVAAEVSERNTLNDFLAYASHEIRTPLMSVKGSLDLLEHGELGELPQAALEFVKVANSNSRGLLRLVNDLLEAQQLQTGRIGYDFKVVDSRGLIEDTLKSVSTYATDKQLSVIVRLGYLPNILADPDRVRQALLNLLSNAMEFSPAQSKVLVKAQDIDGRILIEVTNFGAAIPDHIQAQMFERFTRGGDSQKGGGLGLAITKSIVEAHGGSISFISTPENGTTFRLVLPENMSMLTLV